MKTWVGVIIIAYKTNPLKVLVLENKETGNVTTPSGAIENEETLQQAAARELQEEVGWTVDPSSFKSTSIKHEFIYGSQKKERVGDKGTNHLLLLDANNLPEPQETNDTKNAIWLTIEGAKKRISFKDLGDVLELAFKHHLKKKHSINLWTKK